VEKFEDLKMLTRTTWNGEFGICSCRDPQRNEG